MRGRVAVAPVHFVGTTDEGLRVLSHARERGEGAPSGRQQPGVRQPVFPVGLSRPKASARP